MTTVITRESIIFADGVGQTPLRTRPRMNETSGRYSLRGIVRKGRAVAVMACSLAYALAITSSCGEGKKVAGNADALLEFGDSVLTKSEVVAKIPVGISAADSAAMFRTIVERWVEDMLLIDMAEERIDDLDEIERKVDDYRRQLIVARYLATVRANGRRRPTRESLKAYYETHADDMILETPLVKGIYVKVASRSERLDDIKKWVRSGSDAAVDNLEKYGLGQALQYDYFKDRWLDWSTIAEQIPYRFSNPETFLDSLTGRRTSGVNIEESANGNPGFFETEKGGAVYLLHVSQWLPSGSAMPYEFAASLISNILEGQEAEAYERRLINSLYKKAKKEKRLRIVSYDPALDAVTGKK